MSDTRLATITLLLDVKGVASTLGLGVRTVWRLSSTGVLPAPIAIGRSKRWERRAIESWIAAKVGEVTTKPVRRKR